MAPRTFNCQQVSLNHSEMVKLRKARLLTLRIDAHLATQLLEHGIASNGKGGFARFSVWTWIGVAVAACSIYLGLTVAWWWSLGGCVALLVILVVTTKSNSAILLDVAMTDGEFYERVRRMNGWLYQMEAALADRFLLG